MVLRAMFTGVSGLRAEGEAIGVVGDNIANVNTVGFKSQRLNFQDILGRSILAGGAQPGAGVRAGDIQQIFTQGSLINTGIGTDLALSGDGFFTLRGSQDGITGDFYSRAGQMLVNESGYLVNTTGMFLQGYAADATGAITATVTDLQVPTASLPALATSQVQLTLNLDSAAPVLPVAFDPLDPSTTSNYANSVPVFDSLGAQHSLDFYFTKTGDNTWDYHVLAAGDALSGGTPGIAQEVGTGTVVFDTNGALLDGGAGQFQLDFTGGATPGQTFMIDFGDDVVNDGTTGLGGTTQFASGSSLSAANQDGYASGDFSALTVDGQGVVLGNYTNGRQIAIGQLAIAKFRSNEGLARAGGTLWIETRESGTATLGTAASGGRAAVSSGALEQSNVDLAEQFVGLIQHQRSFAANSRTITTADEMLQELLSIKR